MPVEVPDELLPLWVYFLKTVIDKSIDSKISRKNKKKRFKKEKFF